MYFFASRIRDSQGALRIWGLRSDLTMNWEMSIRMERMHREIFLHVHTY